MISALINKFFKKKFLTLIVSGVTVAAATAPNFTKMSQFVADNVHCGKIIANMAAIILIVILYAIFEVAVEQICNEDSV